MKETDTWCQRRQQAAQHSLAAKGMPHMGKDEICNSQVQTDLTGRRSIKPTPKALQRGTTGLALARGARPVGRVRTCQWVRVGIGIGIGQDE